MREVVVVGFGGTVGGDEGDGVLCSHGGEIDDGASLLSLHHRGDDMVAHKSHSQDIHIDLISNSLLSNLMEISNI